MSSVGDRARLTPAQIKASEEEHRKPKGFVEKNPATPGGPTAQATTEYHGEGPPEVKTGAPKPQSPSGVHDTSRLTPDEKKKRQEDADAAATAEAVALWLKQNKPADDADLAAKAVYNIIKTIAPVPSEE